MMEWQSNLKEILLLNEKYKRLLISANVGRSKNNENVLPAVKLRVGELFDTRQEQQ